MTIRFACPSCAVTGSVDASAVGKSARCKYCGHRFNIPRPGEVQPQVYDLEEPAEETKTAGAGFGDMDQDPFSAFAPTRGDEPTTTAPRRPKQSASGSTTRKARKHASRSAWPTRLAWVGAPWRSPSPRPPCSPRKAS